MPWLRLLVVGLPSQKPGFDPGSVHVGFEVDKVALGRFFPRVLRFSPVRFIPPLLHYLDKWKNWSSFSHLYHNVEHYALRLRCVRSFCCGALHHKKRTSAVLYVNQISFPHRPYQWFQNLFWMLALFLYWQMFSRPSHVRLMSNKLNIINSVNFLFYVFCPTNVQFYSVLSFVQQCYMFGTLSRSLKMNQDKARNM